MESNNPAPAISETVPQGSPKAQTVGMLQRNYLAEVQAAALYRDLSKMEKNPKRKAVLLRMAEAEERHAGKWEQKLLEMGVKPQRPASGWRTRVRRWWTRSAGVDLAISRQEAAEDEHAALYDAQQRQLAQSDPEVGKIFHEIGVEERAHARVLSQMVPVPGPRTILDGMLRRERWHGRGGGWVSDAIYGVNDGLGSVFGIVSGVAGATIETNPQSARHYILLAGLAGMMASALSMGAGAYLAVKSEREVHEAEISREKEEIEENPEEEKEELSLFYQLQGFPAEDADRMAQRVSQDPEQMVRVMAQNELGLTEEHFRNPWVSAASAALSTGVGAFIPIIPFFFIGGLTGVIIAFGVSLAAHFAVGAAKSVITNRTWWASGSEMTLVGVIEAAVTYGLGFLFGAIG